MLIALISFIVADIDPKKIRNIKKLYPRITVVPTSVIHKQKVDVFVPCAMSGVLNSKSVSEIRSEIVAGSANNQIADPSIDKLLYKLGILYAPDYAINAGGLISVADEFENDSPSQTRILEKLANIRTVLASIFTKSAKGKKGTGSVANEMAEKIFNGND